MSLLARCVLALALGGVIFYLGRITAPKSGLEQMPGLARAPAVSARDPAASAQSNARAAETPSTEPEVRSWKTRVEQTAPSEEREEERLRMIVAWAHLDPAAALDYARKNLTQDRKAQAVSSVFTAWAQKDPSAAWNWILTHEEGRSEYLRSVLGEVGKTQPALAQQFAAGYAQQHPEQSAEIYLAALDGVIHAGKYEDAKAMLASAKMPNEEQSNSLINFLAGQWAHYQPEAAASWVMGLPAGPVRDQALDALGQAWSDSNPLQAADFAVKLPPGPVRQTALRQAISKWTMDDPAQASKWILQFDAHQDFDQAVAAIATAPNLMFQNTNLALSWAGTIQNEVIRTRSITAIVANWYSVDANAALNYINTTPDLTPDSRRELISRVVPPAPAPPSPAPTGPSGPP